jgi:hypothetical protein
VPDSSARALVLDACCVLTLAASGQVADLVAPLPLRACVEAYVAEEEALEVYDGPADAPKAARRAVDLQALADAGALDLVVLTGEEEALFVELAARHPGLDDGETRSLAVALARGWALATDDGAALRVVREAHPSVTTWRTPDLVKAWAEATEARAGAVRDVVQRIEVYDGYRVARDHPLRDWWMDHRTGR